MTVYIDAEKCIGCGLCVETCPVEAIQLVNGIAQIDYSLCRECEACIDVCTSGALSTKKTAIPTIKREQLEIVKTQPDHPVPVNIATQRQPSNWASVILALLSSDLIPRITDLVNTILAQKSQRPLPKTLPIRYTSNINSNQQRRMRRRAQYRSRRLSNSK